MAVLIIMSLRGEDRYEYDQETQVGVLEAERAFEETKEDNFLAYMIDEANNATVVDHLPLEAEKVIMAPILAGG